MHRGRIEWDDVVGDLYSAAADPAAASRLAGQIARLVGGAAAALWTLDARGAITDRMLTTLPAEAADRYAAHYHAHDPWLAKIWQTPPDAVIRGSSLIDDASLARSQYYNEFGKQLDTFHLVGAMLPLGPASGQTVGMLSVLRPRDASGFDGDEVARLAQLLPHVRRALQLRAQVADVASAVAAASAHAVLEAFGTAAAVMDGHGRVLLANAMADRLDARGAGLTLRGGADRTICVTAPAETRRLHAAIADAARGGPGGALLLHLTTGPVLATVSPLSPSLGDQMGQARWRALLLLRPLQEENSDGRPPRQMALFGLTPAEMEVTAALCAGLTPREIAQARQVRVSTVRTLLQRAQEKLDAGNLRDLVRVCTLLGS
jgi:DNA-binding CsgD family transcriptional regulator